MPPDENPQAEASKATSEVDQAWQELAGSPLYRRRWVQVFVGLLAAAALSAIVPYPLYVTSECTIVAARRARVHVQTDGILGAILVAERDQVREGQVLARLDDREVRRRRQALAGELSTLGDQATQLGRQPAATGGLLAAVREERAAALRVERARVEIELAALDQQITEQLVLRAPITGVVLTSRLAERVGSPVAAGDILCEIADQRRVNAEILVEERDLSGITVGLPVRVKVSSHPTAIFHGTIGFIAPTVTLDPPGRVRVVAELDNSDGLLADNMSGYGEIKGGEQSILRLVTRRLLGWLRVRYLL